MSQHTDTTHPQSSLAKLAARKAGHSAITIVVCIVIWAFTRGNGGSFWPGWIIFIALLDFVIRVGKAALGDAKERSKLERKYGDTQ